MDGCMFYGYVLNMIHSSIKSSLSYNKRDEWIWATTSLELSVSRKYANYISGIRIL